MLGGSETCFRIILDPKMTSWEPKNVLDPINQDFYKHAIIRNISKLEVGILKYHDKSFLSLKFQVQSSRFSSNSQFQIFKFQL